LKPHRDVDRHTALPPARHTALPPAGLWALHRTQFEKNPENLFTKNKRLFLSFLCEENIIFTVTNLTARVVSFHRPPEWPARQNRGRADESKIRWIKGQKQAQCYAIETESRNSGVKQAGRFALALSRITEIGEQAVAAIAASLARGGSVVKSQLIASHFYKAMQRELKQLPMHDTKRAALIAASERCERIAAASINPTALLDELRNAIAVLEADMHRSVSPPTKARPVLRLIEGGLSKA
jgi:hypothetical protein